MTDTLIFGKNMQKNDLRSYQYFLQAKLLGLFDTREEELEFDNEPFFHLAIFWPQSQNDLPKEHISQPKIQAEGIKYNTADFEL